MLIITALGGCKLFCKAVLQKALFFLYSKKALLELTRKVDFERGTLLFHCRFS